LAKLDTVNDAGALAAGALDLFIATHGETMIEQVEAMARRSPRFRFVLTGVWPQLRSHEDYWKRVEKAPPTARH